MENLLEFLRRRFGRSGEVPRYAWVVLAVVSVYQVFGISLILVGGIMVPLLHMGVSDGGAFGWSAGLVGLGVSLFFLLSGFVAPICGVMGGRLGGRPMPLLQASLYAGGMTLMAFMHAGWHFFLGYTCCCRCRSSWRWCR